MPRKPVPFNDVEDAFDMTNFGEFSEIEAWVDRQGGVVLVRFPEGAVDEEEPLPDDIETNDRYVPMADKLGLDLGVRLVMRFARERMPEDFNTISNIFSRRGAYGRFKDFLDRKDRLQEWFDYEEQEKRAALRDWCDESGIELAD